MTKALARMAPDDREATAAYVAELAGDLASLSRRHGLDTLGYILEMAKLEAENIHLHPAPKRQAR